MKPARLRPSAERDLVEMAHYYAMQWLYFEAEDHLDVVRLLGDRQDIIAILGNHH